MKNNLKIARVSLSMTQKELANKVGVTRQTISLIEKGVHNPLYHYVKIFVRC